MAGQRGTIAVSATKVTMLAYDDTDGTGKMAIVISPSTRRFVHCWISATSYGAPAAVTGMTVGAAGTIITTHAANADLSILANTEGAIILDINLGGAATRYVMVEVAGVAWSKVLIVTA